MTGVQTCALPISLQETQQTGIKLDGDIYDPKYHEKYIKEVIKLVEDKERQVEMRNKALEISKQFSWNLVVNKWNEELLSSGKV